MSYDMTNGGTKVPARRLGIRGKMLASIGLILACGLVATGVAFIGYARVDAMIAVVTGRSIPAMNTAQTLALQAETLVSLAPRLASADDMQVRDDLSKRLKEAADQYQALLSKLADTGWAGDRLGDLQNTSAALLANLKEVDEAVGRRLELATKRAAQEKAVVLAEKMARQVISSFKADLGSQMEDQLNVMRGSSDANEINDAAQSLVKINEDSKRGDQISDAVTEIRTWLGTGAASSVDQQITISRSRSGLLFSNIDTMTSYLPPDAVRTIKEPVNKLRDAATAPDGLLSVHKDELQLRARSAELITANANLSKELSSAVSALVEQQEAGIHEVSAETGKLLADSRTMQIIAAIAGIVISAAVGLLYVGKRVVNRLIALNRTMSELARGNLDTPIDLSGSDEISDMGRTLQVFRETSREMEETRQRSEAERQQAAKDRRKAILAVADSFEATVKQVVHSVSLSAEQMHAIAKTMTSTAGETSKEAGSAASAAMNASENVSGAASAAQQLKASIAEIAKRAADAAAIAGRASTDARHADDTVRSLGETVGKIDSVLELITSIAGQTNLLALNATIEAARAGEAGKGFAVVASEVKNLAGQTAKATEQIEVQIASVHKVTTEAVSAIRSIADTVMTIDEIAAAIAAAVEEQDGATAEIARNVTRAADGTTLASSNIGKVRTAAESTGRSAEDVLSAAGNMTNEAGRLLKQVDQFLAQVRAA